jgi:hypothetical protein
MSAVKREITSAAELADYFDKKGDLHDCVVDLFQWQPSSKSIEVRLLDVNANFHGLPEYEGLTPCILRFKGVEDVSFDISSLSEKLRLYEVEVSLAQASSALKMFFSPAGSMAFSFAGVEFLELV